MKRVPVLMTDSDVGGRRSNLAAGSCLLRVPGYHLSLIHSEPRLCLYVHMSYERTHSIRFYLDNKCKNDSVSRQLPTQAAGSDRQENGNNMSHTRISRNTLTGTLLYKQINTSSTL